MMNTETNTMQAEISSWNDNIFTFGLDGASFQEDTLDARIDRALVGFDDTTNPQCEQFICSAFWPLV